MQPAACDHIDPDPQQVLQFLLEPDMVQQAAMRFEVHEEVDIACGPCFTARDRSENRHVRCPITTADVQDLGTSGLDQARQRRAIRGSRVLHGLHPP